jgi:hypothetical protein
MVMAVGPALASKMGNSQAAIEKGASFKQIMANKQEMSHAKPPPSAPTLSVNSWSRVLNDMAINHEAATKSIKSSMVRTNYTPEKLLNFQYETGILLLREQMFCKTAELSANTLKNFTQMQV